MNVYIWEEIPPLNFTANTAGSTVKLVKNGAPTEVTLETSTDGSNWNTYTIEDTITLSNIGDKVYFRNTSETDTGFSINNANRYYFIMSGSITGSGDVTSLLNKNGTDTLSQGCFNRLFNNCTSLVTPPQLLATTIAQSCYSNMFNGCSSLTTAPSLPATTLANSCYYAMFQSCTSLTTPPSLPATTLDEKCYINMFNGCTNLKSITLLPATTLANYCYNTMFSGCSKIKISISQTGDYQTAYRIPTTGTGTTVTRPTDSMFTNTGGTFKGSPSINTTYYTSNTVV